MELLSLEKSALKIKRPEFYASHPEANRTLRMDTGGICQFCARKAARRVELHSPLWKAGPLMYGECCLPLAESSLFTSLPKPGTPADPRDSEAWPNGRRWNAWLSGVAVAGLGGIVVGLARLLHLGRPLF